jgi:hypothetical protein
MKTTLTNSAPGLVAVRVAAIAFVTASADTNPLVPSGPNPMAPIRARLLPIQPRRGLHANGFLDVPC